jgi:hypothetical protein
MLVLSVLKSALACACACSLSAFPAPTARQLVVEQQELLFRARHGIGGDALVHLRHVHGFQHGLAVGGQRLQRLLDDRRSAVVGQRVEVAQLLLDGAWRA